MNNRTAQIQKRYAPLLERSIDFSPPEGWLGIVNSLVADLARILREADVPPGAFSVRQVKEKFGGLRVYVAGLPSNPQPVSGSSDWVSDAEADPAPDRPSREWHFEGVCTIDFDERLADASIARILAAISASAYVPEAVAQQIRRRIEAARQEADRTCQLCGAEGDLVVENGWHMTLCEEHRDGKARAAWHQPREERS